jgi:hypothetical protein
MSGRLARLTHFFDFFAFFGFMTSSLELPLPHQDNVGLQMNTA